MRMNKIPEKPRLLGILKDDGNLPVEDYLKQQGRFSHLGKEDFEYIHQKVDYERKALLQRSIMESFQVVM